jgi:spermidine/putrescine transport system substrate-binding protein
MIKQGMLLPIDKSKLHNLGNIDPLILKKATYDPGMKYSVPYFWGAAGVTVNTAKVPTFDKSWNIFARTDLKGQMTMLDDMREVMGDALVTLGYSVNETNPDHIKAAADLILNKWKPNLVKFDAESFGKGYASGDFSVVQGYSEVVRSEIAANKDLVSHTQFFIPKEGGPSYIDSMCILKDAPHPDLALKFIDFILRPEIYAEFVNYFGLPSTVNVPARKLVKGTPAYGIDDLARTTIKDDVGAAIQYYNDQWFNRIRIGD